LYNVSGESIKCYDCNSHENSKCADPLDRSALETTECSKSALGTAASVVGKGLDVLKDIFGMTEIPQGSDIKLACKKIDFSGKKV